MASELTQRLLVGPLLAAAVAGAFVGDRLCGGHYFLVGLILVAANGGIYEYARLLRRGGWSPHRSVLHPAVSCLVAAPLIASLAGAPTAPYGILIVGAAMVAGCLRHLATKGYEDAPRDLGATALGIIYLGAMPGLLVHLILIEGGETGAMRGSLLFLLAVCACKLGDVFAFAGGKCFGRHKLVPRVSPGKTWEGFAASFVGSIGGSYLLTWILVATGAGMPFACWWSPLIWGLVLGPLGVLGDLLESMFKRALGVKDSGSSLPGFGGFLDVFDALILMAPAAYALALVL